MDEFELRINPTKEKIEMANAMWLLKNVPLDCRAFELLIDIYVENASKKCRLRSDD